MLFLRPNSRSYRFAKTGCFLIASLCCCLSDALAQLPQTTITAVYPPGGQIGTTFDVAVSGPTVIDVQELLFSQGSIRATLKSAKPDEFATADEPQFGKFSVQIDKGVPPGKYEVRAVGRHGISNPLTFIVGSKPEVLGDGSNRSPEKATTLELGQVVSGKTAASAIDFYQVALKKGQRICVDCQAQQIDSRLNAVVSMMDKTKVELARAFALERDPVIFFTAPRTDTFFVKIHDEIYSGGDDYFYRMSIHTDPVILSSMPLAIAPSGKASLQLIGWNLPQGKPSPITWKGAPLLIQTQNVASRPPANSRVRPLVPQFPSLLVANCPGTEVPVFGNQRWNLAESTAAVVLEIPAETTKQKPQKIAVPCEINGRFYPDADEDWYEFEAKKDLKLWIEVVSNRMGTDADPYFLIQRMDQDKEEKLVTVDILQADDPSTRNAGIRNSYSIASDDPSVLWTVPQDGTYRIMVRDQFGSARRDPRSCYRLVIRPPKPDFHVIGIPQELKTANNNNVPAASISLRRGQTTAIRLLIDRREGFAEELDIAANKLPAGITAEPIHCGPTSRQAWLILHASHNAPAFRGSIDIQAKSIVAEKPVTRRVQPACVIRGTTNQQLDPAMLRPTSTLMLDVRDKDTVPVELTVSTPHTIETCRGGETSIKLKLTKQSGFDDVVTVVAMGLPGEIKLANLAIAKGKADGEMKLTINNANTKPGTYSFFLRGDTKFKFSIDPDGTDRATKTQQRLDELLKKANEELAGLTKQNTEADAALKTAQTALQTAQKAVTAQKGKPEEAQAKVKLEQAQKLVDGSLAHQTTIKTQRDTSDAKQKKITAIKKTADQNLANIKKNAAPKDMNFASITQPMILRVASSPISVNGTDKVSIKAGAAADYEVNVAKTFGFDEPVQVKASVPKGVSGISFAAANIAKGQPKTAMKITIAKNAKPGSYPISVTATSRFRNVSVTAETKFTLTIESAGESTGP